MTRPQGTRQPGAALARSAVFGATLAAALFGGSLSVLADQITVWSGYPELTPFYQHVADGLKALELAEAAALSWREGRVVKLGV